MKKAERAAVMTAVLTSFAVTFMGSALNLSVPDMSREFGAKAGEIGWVVTIYMLAAAALAVPAGKIADRTSRKGVLVTGILLFGAASFLGIFAKGMSGVVAARGAQGIGAALIFATSQAILMRECGGEQCGRALGYATAATYTGLAMGPVIGGILEYRMGWRAIFGTAFFISLAALLIAARALPARLPERKGLGSEKGAALDLGLYIGAITAFIFGLTEFTRLKAAPYLTALGAALGISFACRMRRSDTPLLDVRFLVKNRGYAFANLAALLQYGATYAISYLLSVYLQEVKGFTPQRAGFVLIASPLVMALLSPLAGRLSDRISPAKMAAVGMMVTTGSLLLLHFTKEESPVPFLVAGLMLSGLGSALFSSPNTKTVLSGVSGDALSTASSLLATMRSFGHTLSMAVVMLLVGIYLGEGTLRETSPDAVVQTVRTAFLVFSGFSAGGTLLAFCSEMKVPSAKRKSRTGGRRAAAAEAEKEQK